MNSKELLANLTKKYGSAKWDQFEIQRFCYYDYIRYPVAGATVLTFFSQPMGGTDPTSLLMKTQEDTNMNKQASFGQVYFCATEIRTHVAMLPSVRQHSTINAIANSTLFTTFNDVHNAIANLCQQGVLRLSIMAKEYCVIPQPFISCPPGIGLDIAQNAATTGAAAVSTQTVYVQQDNDRENVYALTPFIEFEPEVQFSLRIEFPNGTSPSIPQVSSQNVAVNVGVWLDGYILRPVQ